MTTAQSDPAAGAPARRAGSTTDLALVASFAALIAACSVLGGIPVGGGGVDITLQTFAIGLTGALLGPARGFLATALYLALGAAGLPVLSGHVGGIGHFTGITAGYLWSFPLVALLTGLLVRHLARSRRTSALVVLCCVVPGVLLNHAAGIAGMRLHADVSWATAAAWDAPFWVGDLAKALVVALVAAEVHKAFPWLLGRARQG